MPLHESNTRSYLKIYFNENSSQKNRHSLTKIPHKTRLTSQVSMIIFQIFPKYFLIENMFWDIIIVYFEMLFEDKHVHYDVYQTSMHKGMRSIFSYKSGMKFKVCDYF